VSKTRAKNAIVKALEKAAAGAALPPQQQKEPYVALPASVVQAFANYLDDRPHKEARPFLDAIQRSGVGVSAEKVDAWVAQAQADQQAGGAGAK
jgi:hypothetical protein